MQKLRLETRQLRACGAHRAEDSTCSTGSGRRKVTLHDPNGIENEHGCSTELGATAQSNHGASLTTSEKDVLLVLCLGIHSRAGHKLPPKPASNLHAGIQTMVRISVNAQPIVSLEASPFHHIMPLTLQR